MFGLKIVRTQVYKDLNWRLEQALKLIDEKDSRINELNDTVNKKETELNNYKARVTKLEKDVKILEEPKQLLTDVAEKPLVEETKPRKTVKSTGGGSTRKKVVHKSDVL